MSVNENGYWFLVIFNLWKYFAMEISRCLMKLGDWNYKGAIHKVRTLK